MKICTLLFALSLPATLCCAQSAAIVMVHDTRSTNEAPGTHSQAVRFDFKERVAVGLPGSATYTTVLTVAPWVDASGDKQHQLNFNNDGLDYRNGTPGGTWSPWRKLLISDDQGQFNIAGSGGLKLRPGTVDHAYLEFYARTANAGARSGYFGFSSAGANSMTLANQISGGNILMLTTGGNIGIDTHSPMEKLAVNGKIRAHEIKVETANWPDYVFMPGYRKMTLAETKAFINQHGHLPEVPSAAVAEKEGVQLGEMNKVLLKKIEELTLHVIELSERLERAEKSKSNNSPK